MFIRRILSPSIIALLGVLCIATPGTVRAQMTIARGWPLSATGALKIFADAGSVRIVGWDRDSVAVSGTVAAGYTFFGGGGLQGVKVGVENTNAKNAAASDLVVYVPARARVWIKTAMADVDVSALAGALDASTVGGQLHVQGTLTEVRAETMNGSLEMNGSPAYLRLKTATGNITWTGSSDDVEVITVSGRVVLHAGTVQRARFESIDGEIRFTGGLAPSASLAVDTHSGNVMLAFQKGSSARLEVSAPACDLFGVREGRMPGGEVTPVSRTFYSTVGKAALAGVKGSTSSLVVVRSYKGFVTASLQ